MARCRLTVGFLAVAIVAAAAAGGRPLPRRVSSPHTPSRHLFDQVTSIAFSRDGKWVAASYSGGGYNRIGTDWRAFVAEWEVEGKTRTIVPDAYCPIAFSPDSKTMAMGIYKRKGHERSPRVRLAIWDVGKPSLRCILPGQDARPIAAVAWSGDSKRLAAVTKSAGLLMWDSDHKSLPVHIPAKSPLDDVKVRRGRRYGHRLTPSGIAFSADGKSLQTVFAAGDNRYRAVFWREGKQGFTPVKSYFSGPMPRDALKSGAPPKGGWLYTIIDKKYKPTVMVTDPRRIMLTAPHSKVRISGDGKLIAIARRGKTVLLTNSGKLVKTFPAGGGAVAFSGDSKRLAAADNRAIIRVWDIASGKLIRTMRLDGHDKENTVLAAAIQCASKFGDPAGNRKRIASYVTRAAQKGAKIVVLPETAITGYMSSDIKTAWQVPGRELSEDLKGVNPKDAAETVPGPSTKFFAPIADAYGIYLTVPLLEVDRKTGKYYNTSVLLGPNGRILIHYRKRNPWIWAEKGWAEDGNVGNPVVDTPFGRLGLLICFDVHDQFKVMSELKIDTLLYSIAWVDDVGSDWFSVQLPARVKDSGFNAIGANWTIPKNPKPTWHGYGQSLIISSKGKILAKAKNDLAEETVFAEIPIPAK